MERRTSAAAIVAEALSVVYRASQGRKVEAVSALNLSIAQGEIVGFIGPNGAGKTSTIKVLMGFLRPSSGAARVLGEPAGTLGARRRTGYLPEVALYYPFLNARETLEMYGVLQGLPRAERRGVIEALLDRVGLRERAGERLRTYSKGMLQRVGIAQAILGDPDLLILDEVTAGLDPIARHDVREILLDFKRRGKTVFFSSHELSEVALLCDRIILIDRGQVLEEQRLADVLSAVQRVEVTVRGAWRPDALPAGVSVLPASNGDTVFAAETGAACQALIESATRDGRVVASQQQTPGSLEDYFVGRIGHRVT